MDRWLHQIEKKSHLYKEWTLKRKQTTRRHHKVILGTLLMGFSWYYTTVDVHATSKLQTVFHVYADDQYIGILEDKKQLEELKDEKLRQVASDHKDLQLIAGSNLSLVPEKVFATGTDDQAVLQKLDEVIAVEAEAVGVEINGEILFYVKDQQTFDEVIRQLKLQSVTEQELAAYEARLATTEPLPPLKQDETRIQEILLSAEVEAVEDQALPNEVLTVKEALTLINKGTLQEKTYTIQEGDVLGNIAAKHQMTTAQLMELNPGVTEETLLQIGDELNVTVLKPLLTVDVHYETKIVQPVQHKKITEKDPNQFRGEKEIKQKGVDGKKEVTKLVRKRNGKVLGSSVLEEKVLEDAVDEITVVGSKVIPSRGTGAFVWPVVGGYISSQMGYRWGTIHQGIDIARPSSYDILAADNGVVTEAGYHGTFGNRVVITHNNGYETLYAHLSSISVSPGQVVPAGTKIGVMGSTGRSTGVHLHFEVFENGSNIDPLSVLK